MNVITIDQAPPTTFRLGLEKDGLNSYSMGTNSFEIPKKGNKWNHGLTPEQEAKIEAHYGRSFSNPLDNSFWGDMLFELRNFTQSLDMTDPHNILMVSVGKQLGYVAENIDEVKENPMHQFTYIIKDSAREHTQDLSLYERTDEAIITLSRVKKQSNKYLLALAFYCTPNPFEIGTNSDLAYTRLRKLINGEYTESKREGLSKFEAAVALEKAYLYATNDVRWAIRKNIIRRGGDLIYYNPMSGVQYGKTEAKIVEFLLATENQDEYGVTTNPSPTSIKEQLKKLNL